MLYLDELGPKCRQPKRKNPGNSLREINSKAQETEHKEKINTQEIINTQHICKNNEPREIKRFGKTYQTQAKNKLQNEQKNGVVHTHVEWKKVHKAEG